MSRLMMLFVALIYVAGGLVTGYYAYALRLQAVAAEAGLSTDMVAQFVQQNYSLVGIALLFLAFFLHLSQIGKARRVDQRHTQAEKALEATVQSNKSQIDVLRQDIEENRGLIDFCRSAITEAAAKRGPLNNPDAVILDDPPKDYSDPAVFPIDDPDESK